MTTPSSLIELKNTLPQLSWPQIIPALRQDALIWQSLQNLEFRELAISRLGNDHNRWNPASLSLLSLEIDLDSNTLRAKPLGDIEPELRVQAIQTYESHMADDPPEMTLPTAGLLALALQEHHRLTNSWENIPQSGDWQTAYACLFGLLAHPLKMLSGLPTAFSIHAILANPLSEEDQINALISISASMTTRNRLVMLRELAHQRPDLATTVAQKLWHSDQESSNLPQMRQNYLSNLFSEYGNIQTLTDSLTNDLAHAEAQLTSGYSQKGATSLQLAWHTSRQIQNTLASQLTQVSARLGNINKSQSDWTTAQNYPEIPPKNTAALALTWIEQGFISEAQALLMDIEDRSDPTVQLAFVNLYFQQGDQKAAKEAASLASEAAFELSNESQLLLAQRLLDLGLASEANHVLEIAQRSQPNRKDIIHLAAKGHAAVGAYPQAIHAIHLAVAFDPGQVDIYRDYAILHELAGLWPAAMEAREHIIEAQNDPEPPDFHALAKCAIKLDQFQKAQKACLTALERNPEDGLAHALLGQALLGIGDLENAREHLQMAIRYSPDQALPWLAMAQFHSKADNTSEATETLRKAIHAAPDQIEIHLALGENHLLAGSQSQALTCLRRANQLTQVFASVESFHLRSRIALPYAKTLFELGHADEALQTIQATFPLPENQVEMLHLQAQILSFMNQPDQAIPLLAKALLVDPSNGVIIIDYARAQLAADHDLDKAISALLSLLEKDPKNSEALAWLAEALKANGDPTNALTAYRKALGTTLSEDPHWHPRLSIGLAQSAIDLDQPETALAALQKNWQTSPQNHLVISQTLAAAYKKARLFDKALQSARSAREMEPTSLDNLVWFADFADGIQAYDEAAGALNYALELEPNRSDIRLSLGTIYQKVGDFTEAYNTIRVVGEIDQSTNPELRTAAKHLVDLNYPEDAIICLKIAVQRCLESTEKKPCSTLIFELIDIFLQLGRHADALASLNEFLDQQIEKDPALLGKRAILLNHVSDPEDAYAALDQAYTEYPNSIPLHLAASRIHYENSNLGSALEHAQKAVETLNDNASDESPYTTLALAADISDACLQTINANEILQHASDMPDFLEDLSYLCLRSELALESNEEIDAAKALTNALELSPEDPRVLALQARLTARHGDIYNANLTLKNALSTWGDHQHQEIVTPAGILGISEAALELHKWDSAIYLLREAVNQFPQEPRTHLRLARGLVLRAEHQRLCETLQVIHHAPGSFATADFTYKQFEQLISEAVKTSDGLKLNTNQSAITHWRVRGQAIFQPIEEHAKALGEIPHTPESYGAFLAALRYSRENQATQQIDIDALSNSHQQLEQKSGSSINLLVEIALALSTHNPEAAKTTAQNVLDTSIRQRYPSQPIFFAVQTAIAEQAGDFLNAGIALENALSQWNDEARWHLWAAEILQAQAETDFDAVLGHLSQAAELEPKYGLHHLKLGQALLQQNNPQAAIPALEEATRLLSQKATPWLALARAYQGSGDIAQIFHNAERAAELDPTNIETYILMAESALEVNNPEKAIQYCQNGLEVNAAHPQLMLIQAHALDMVGKYQEALKVFDGALKYSPKSVRLMLDHAQTHAPCYRD